MTLSMTKTLGATMLAGSALLAGASSATATTTPIVHTCNTGVSHTYSGVTYYAPAYKDATGYNACTIPVGTTNTTVGYLQKGINTAISTLKLKGATPITTFNYYGPTTVADLKIFQAKMGITPSGKFDAATSSALLEPLGAYLAGDPS